jgi:hypothetical protein
MTAHSGTKAAAQGRKAITYTVNGREGTSKVDACPDCRECLGLPESPDKRNVRVTEQPSSLIRPDPCVGCGYSATGYGSGEPVVCAADRDASVLAVVLNMAEELDVFATFDGNTEEVALETDDGTTLVADVRRTKGSPEGLHVMIEGDGDGDRAEMEARSENIAELLLVNGFGGTPQPTGSEMNDWEMFGVEVEQLEDA